MSDERVPDFDNAEWERQMKSAYGEDGPVATAVLDEPQEEVTLTTALGGIEDLDDLWPGYCYQPPKLKHLETIIPLTNKMGELFNDGEVLQAMDCAVQVVLMLARKYEDGQYKPVTRDEITNTFDEDEIAVLIQHILNRQGLLVEGTEKNVASGRTGLKNFLRSAASTTATE